MQIDITKGRPPHVWMGFDEEDFTVGRWQAIQYEGLPEFLIANTKDTYHKFVT